MENGRGTKEWTVDDGWETIPVGFDRNFTSQSEFSLGYFSSSVSGDMSSSTAVGQWYSDNEGEEHVGLSPPGNLDLEDSPYERYGARNSGNQILPLTDSEFQDPFAPPSEFADRLTGGLFLEYQYNGSANVNTPSMREQQLSTKNYIDDHQDKTIRHTPRSLNWSSDTENVKLYRFVMDLEELHFELLPQHNPTAHTPSRVYLDQPECATKGKTFCCWPECTRTDAFARPADLARHYQNVHSSSKDKNVFRCPYRPCANGRDQDGNHFTRKDHLRNHLRDYHVEDIGFYKGPKMPRTEEEMTKWRTEEKKWLASRRIDAKWWTCAKCLERRWVKVDGWDCPSCRVPCATERKEARLRISKPADDMEEYDQEGTPTFSDIGTPSSDYSQMGTRCFLCNGLEWVDSCYGEWEPCEACSIGII
ncbi:hypothetical protein IFR05_006245 [Cadophora sp. M221]|nr:hypothetical protein IFR05_006245 [Cadophora sp. M221]